YKENRQAATLASLEDSPVAKMLIQFACLGGLIDYMQSASDLLRSLYNQAEPRIRSTPRWPRTPRALANELRRVAPMLRTRGIVVEFIKTAEKRLIRINALREFNHLGRLDHFS